MKRILLTLFFSIFTMVGLSAQDMSLEQGKIYFNSKEFDQAKHVFESILNEDDKNAVAHYWIARAYLRLGKIDEAVDHAKESVELDNKNAAFHFGYAQALGREVQEASMFRKPFLAPTVLEEFEKTIELDPKHAGGYAGAAQFYFRAPSIMGGDINKAKEYANIMIDLEESQGFLLLAQILQSENKNEEAEEVFSKYDSAFNDSTDNASFYNSYGYFLIGQKKFDLAIEKFKRQIELKPASANSYDSLGDGYRAAGQLEEALASYKKAVEIDPNFEASKVNVEEVEEEIKK